MIPCICQSRPHQVTREVSDNVVDLLHSAALSKGSTLCSQSPAVNNLQRSFLHQGLVLRSPNPSSSRWPGTVVARSVYLPATPYRVSECDTLHSDQGRAREMSQDSKADMTRKFFRPVGPLQVFSTLCPCVCHPYHTNGRTEVNAKYLVAYFTINKPLQLLLAMVPGGGWA